MNSTQYRQLACVLLFVTAVLGATVVRSVPLLATHLAAPGKNAQVAGYVLPSLRSLYAVNQSQLNRGTISVYDIDAGHRLIKTIQTVPSVGDVRGVAASAVTGKLYVAYRNDSGAGMIYCLNLYNDTVLWNKVIDPGVDRLAINPDGQLLYAPTW